MQNLTPDPMNDEYAIDKDGRLYQRTFIERDGKTVDIGFTLALRERG